MTEFEEWELEPVYQAEQIRTLTKLVRNMIEIMPDSAIVSLLSGSESDLRDLEERARSLQTTPAETARNAAHNIHEAIFGDMHEHVAARADGAIVHHFMPVEMESFQKKLVEAYIREGKIVMPEDW